MTYMGKPYYPVWLDNLADDVTLEAAAMDGAAHGAEDVVEDYTTEIRGERTNVVVWVTFNAAGQTQQVVVNHRPRSALLSFSRLMLEKFADTPLAKHWRGTP